MITSHLFDSYSLDSDVFLQRVDDVLTKCDVSLNSLAPIHSNTSGRCLITILYIWFCWRVYPGKREFSSSLLQRACP